MKIYNPICRHDEVRILRADVKKLNLCCIGSESNCTHSVCQTSFVRAAEYESCARVTWRRYFCSTLP